jgi:hypothetical protein
MPDPNPTVGELYNAKAITDSEVTAAVEAYLANPAPGAHLITDGYQIDVALAVHLHPFARAALSGDNPTPSRKRRAVRTAILLARARKA